LPFAFIKMPVVMSAFVVLGIGTSCQRFSKPPIAPKRLSSDSLSLVISESINLERSGAGDRITITFDTREAANCKLGFSLISAGKTVPQINQSCSSSSATKFSETLDGVPKDQLVVVHLMSWPATSTESSGKIINISESVPSADAQSLNLLMVDVAARRVELTSLQEGKSPTDVATATTPSKPGTCVLGPPVDGTLNGTTKANLIQGASFRGLFSSTLSRVSPTALSGGFQYLQRQSSEWSLTARTGGGFGQLRLAKPPLLKNVIFAGSTQADGLDDSLADIDPPGLGVLGTNTLVSTWTIEGDAGNALATLTVSPGPGFGGITCRGKAADGRLVIPSSFLTKIPTGRRLWATLRIDSWQPLDKERWLVRVSDWSSMGIQR
jgi:hypothetical protein